MAEVSDAQADFYTSLLSQYRGRTLRKGDRSKSTRALQLFLRSKGYDIKADGVFGARTEKAVREWQKSEGLSADGQVGKRSLTKVREQITPRPKERPTAVPRGDFTSPIGFEEEATLSPPTGPAESPMTPMSPMPPPPEDLGVSSGPPPVPATGMVRPSPTFEEEATLPPGLERGGPPPGMPPAVSGGGPELFPGGSPVLPTGPLPDAPVAAPAPMAGPPPTDPSVWAGKFVQPQPVPPTPIPENYTSALDQAADQGMSEPPTQLVQALAAGGAPDAAVPPPSSGGITPEQIAMIQALMQRGGARGLPPGQAGM